MSNEKTGYRSSDWHHGAVRNVVIATASKLAKYEINVPPSHFFEALADHAEEIANEAIAEAINAKQDEAEVALSNLSVAKRLLEVGDDLFLSIEQANDAVLARLAAYLLLEGSDGYNELSYHLAWGAHRDPEWGTIWGIRQDVRDLTPAFIFKVCMKGDTRLLGVECHAPIRRLPNELFDRLRARTVIVSGIPIIAFAPAEIEADVSACVSEIECALSILAHELLALNNIEPPLTRDFRPKAEP